jgi:hypothetical protein
MCYLIPYHSLPDVEHLPIDGRQMQMDRNGFCTSLTGSLRVFDDGVLCVKLFFWTLSIV